MEFCAARPRAAPGALFTVHTAVTPGRVGVPGWRGGSYYRMGEDPKDRPVRVSLSQSPGHVRAETSLTYVICASRPRKQPRNAPQRRSQTLAWCLAVVIAHRSVVPDVVATSEGEIS